MLPRLRRLWLTAHRWMALSLGWILILSGLTGAILVVAQPVNKWAHPELFVAQTQPGPEAQWAPLQPILTALRSQFGPEASLAFNPPKTPGSSLEVMVRGQWRGSVYFDPYTGVEQGRRGETEGFFNALFKLHSSLWMQSAGKALLAWVALIYAALLISGVVLWWPRKWPPKWKPELKKGVLRALFDVHRTFGVLLGVVILVSVLTGAYMAWRPLGGAINWVVGATAVKLPGRSEHATADMPLVNIDRIVVTARRAYPEGVISRIQIPVDPGSLIRVRFKLPDDPHPNGLTSAWIDPVTAGIVKQARWTELDPGTRATSVIYPLHSGILGGALLEAVVALGGLMLATIGASGIWLWWRRRSVSRAQKASRETPGTRSVTTR